VLGIGIILHLIGIVFFFPYATEIAADRCSDAQDLGYRVGMEDWESDWQWCQMNWVDLFALIAVLPMAAVIGAVISSELNFRGLARYLLAATVAMLPFLIGWYSFSRYPKVD